MYSVVEHSVNITDLLLIKKIYESKSIIRYPLLKRILLSEPLIAELFEIEVCKFIEEGNEIFTNQSPREVQKEDQGLLDLLDSHEGGLAEEFAKKLTVVCQRSDNDEFEYSNLKH